MISVASRGSTPLFPSSLAFLLLYISPLGATSRP